MATRTQKAATKAKAKAEGGKSQPKAKPAKAAKATPGKAPKPSSKPSGKSPSKAGRSSGKPPAKAEPFDPIPEPKPTLGERFWHRIGLGAKAKEERAHQQSIEHEAAIQLKIEQDRRDRERAEEDQRAARKAHAAAERKANEKAAREMARLAREEDARLKREAEEAEARAVVQAAEDRKAAAAARREEARVAKLQEAAQAQLLAEEKAAQQREAAAARREAARIAREEAKAQAEREAEEKAAAQAQAAEERAAKRREAAEARREKARQEKLAAEAKAEERRLARQRKVEEKAREEELAQLESEAQARRSAPKMDVMIREKDDEVVEMEEVVEGEAVEVSDEPEAPLEAQAPDEVEAAEPVFHSKEAQADDDEEEEEEDAVEPVAAKANGKASPSRPASDLESQADRVAEELRSRRSKPITIDADDVPAPTLPVGRKPRADEEPKQVLQLDPAPPARSEVAAPRGLSIPEHFLLLALEDVWDERREKATPGNLGGALVGSLLLELVLQDKVRVQRDRFQLTDAAVDDPAAAVVQKLKEVQDRPSLQAMAQIARDLPELLPAYKDRMARRGLIEHRAWRHLGMFYRSQTALVDGDAQERMRNKLARAIAGGGRPDAPTILSLGLLEASGLFGVVVPEGAQAYNRKRLNGLLAGKDVMGYKVDDELKAMQEIAVRTILDNVRLMTARG